MRRIIYYLILIVILSCEKDKIDGLDNKSDLISQIVTGNNQIGYVFQELENDLIIKIKDKDSIPINSASFEFLIDSDNGYICKRYSRVDGEYNFKWLLNCNTGTQFASIIALDSIGRVIDTLEFTAQSEYSKIWNRSCGLPFYDTCEYICCNGQ